MPFTQLDMARLTKYEQYWHIYRGKHDRVFHLDGSDQFPNVIVNIPAAIIKGLAGLVAAKTPEFTFASQQAQQKWVDIAELSSFGSELMIFTIHGLLYGDALLKVVRKEDGSVKINCINPKLWHAIPNPDDIDEIKAHVLGFPRKIGEQNVYRTEVHTPGLIENRFYRMDSLGKLGLEIPFAEAIKLVPEWAELKEEIETGVDELLVVAWSHDRLCGELYGTSELQTIWDLIYALDRRATQEDRILSKHADPKLILEEATIERDMDGNILIRDLDVILIPQGSSKEAMGYITWDGQLGSVESQRRWLVEMQLHTTQVSRLLLNSDTTQAQTGLAVLAQMLPSIMKAESIQKEMEAALRQAVRVSQKLSGTNPRNAKVTKIEWGVQLPSDLQSTVQAETMAVQAGLKTVEEARNDLDKSKNA